jgi:hypothetical protein
MVAATFLGSSCFPTMQYHKRFRLSKTLRLRYRSCYIDELRLQLYRDLEPNPRATRIPLLIHGRTRASWYGVCDVTASDPILVHRLSWLLRVDSETNISFFGFSLIALNLEN